MSLDHLVLLHRRSNKIWDNQCVRRRTDIGRGHPLGRSLRVDLGHVWWGQSEMVSGYDCSTIFVGVLRSLCALFRRDNNY